MHKLPVDQPCAFFDDGDHPLLSRDQFGSHRFTGIGYSTICTADMAPNNARATNFAEHSCPPSVYCHRCLAMVASILQQTFMVWASNNKGKPPYQPQVGYFVRG